MSGPLSGAAAGRLLISGKGGAAENMAIDAAILDSARPEHGPTLRLYRWREPTLSLGYFQPLGQRAMHAESLQLPVVRRGTGGGAIVHDLELTYSLVLPGLGRSPGAASQFYRIVHDAFAACLLDWGIAAMRFADSAGSVPAEEPFLCFQRRTSEDLVVNRYKVLGSAQRRGRGGVLQHGSLLLAASSAAPQLPGLAELSGRSVSADDLALAISQKLGTLCAINWIPGELSAAERAAAEGQLAERFSSAAWTAKK